MLFLQYLTSHRVCRNSLPPICLTVTHFLPFFDAFIMLEFYLVTKLISRPHHLTHLTNPTLWFNCQINLNCHSHNVNYHSLLSTLCSTINFMCELSSSTDWFDLSMFHTCIISWIVKNCIFNDQIMYLTRMLNAIHLCDSLTAT